MEKYWFTIVLYFFLYWKSIRLTLFYVAFCVGKDCFLIGIILEKYWFNIVLNFLLEKYWINIGLCCFSCWKRLLFDWNNFGKVLV